MPPPTQSTLASHSYALSSCSYIDLLLTKWKVKKKLNKTDLQCTSQRRSAQCKSQRNKFILGMTLLNYNPGMVFPSLLAVCTPYQGHIWGGKLDEIL